MGLDSSQACINLCSGYSVFLEAHLQAIINSLECWQNIQTCRQASDDTALGKSSGSRPKSKQGGERESTPRQPRRVVSPHRVPSPYLASTRNKGEVLGRGGASEPHTEPYRTAPHTGLLSIILNPPSCPLKACGGVKGTEEGSSWLCPEWKANQREQ